MGEPSTFEVVAATLDRWSDVCELLGGDEQRGCWCQAWRGRDEVARADGESRPTTLRRQMVGGPPPPGYLAYLDGTPVGWLGVGVRTTTPGLQRSRTIPAIDDLPVWSIGCLRVRPGYRRRGVARGLLAAVIEKARRAGAPGVEAYPIDPEGRRVDVSLAYVGIASMFDAAGFRRVLETGARSAGLPRLLMRLDFDMPGDEPASGQARRPHRVRGYPRRATRGQEIPNTQPLGAHRVPRPRVHAPSRA